MKIKLVVSILQNNIQQSLWRSGITEALQQQEMSCMYEEYGIELPSNAII